ncbi:hypothetical protein E2C01_072508 [Portunus trituberculatus]|uniref:Uncharacterized protein n=1 Tax=Portunus trituberculatus TaxID=210409 RepID=A0A5B7I7C5_PORTR|nr:hypothetical protein [Portunus trituberculatus]
MTYQGKIRQVFVSCYLCGVLANWRLQVLLLQVFSFMCSPGARKRRKGKGRRSVSGECYGGGAERHREKQRERNIGTLHGLRNLAKFPLAPSGVNTSNCDTSQPVSQFPGD